MFLTYRDNAYRISDKSAGAIAHIEPPCVIENGAEQALSPVSQKGDTWLYQGAFDRITVSVKREKDGLFYIKRIWENTAPHERSIKTVFRVAACFDVQKFLIPCVSVNGNPFGAGKEPKGLERDGKKWVFAYDRVSIPACTLTENAAHALSLFASGENERSLVSSCSIWKDADGTYHQELLHPAFESPVSYIDRDTYGDAFDDSITLAAGERFEVGIYVLLSTPKWKNYGICDTLDAALTLFPEKDARKLPSLEKLWSDSITFAKSLISDYNGKKGFIIGFKLNEDGEFVHRGDNCFELAWCGQNILFCRMFIEDYLQNKNTENLHTALEILDTRAKYGVAPNGLLLSQLRYCDNVENTASDTCNMGYGAYEFLRTWKTLNDAGIDKPAYLQAGLGLCDFFCKHDSPTYGFGKKWRHDGTCLDQSGTVGAFIIPALAKAYELTGRQKYLDTAERAMQFYVERDLDAFCCTAGALDTCCVDKETSIPFLISAVLLHKLTGKEIYKEYGKKAAYYFASWMFYYDPIYPSECDVARFGVRIRGLTSVSAQHHHLDPYAGLAVPYFWELAEITGDETFKRLGDTMFHAILQCIGDGELTIHGKKRPIGSQNEAIFHCHWGFKQGDPRGKLNDWLVAWPAAFRLSALSALFKKGFEKKDL
ncbi:MAG: hypothetical protein J6B09_00950 [Clostridia bacterium]|nr:hypothetical protein [Clostridia bacterium]